MSSIYPTSIRTLMDWTTGSWAYSGWGLGPTFSLMTGFSPNSKLKLFYFLPFRNDLDAWSGTYPEIQMQLNEGAWVSLGSGGYDGGTMWSGASSIASYNNTMFINPLMTAEYSVRFRLYFATYGGTSTLNGSNDLNNISGTAPWNPLAANTQQHYAHIIVDELTI